jgi:hypothetical protein
MASRSAPSSTTRTASTAAWAAWGFQPGDVAAPPLIEP